MLELQCWSSNAGAPMLELQCWSSNAFYLYWRNTQQIIPKFIHEAAAKSLEVGMAGYFDNVSLEAQKRWQEIQRAHKKLKGHKAKISI